MNAIWWHNPVDSVVCDEVIESPPPRQARTQAKAIPETCPKQHSPEE
jgi:hypothetical protein